MDVRFFLSVGMAVEVCVISSAMLFNSRRIGCDLCAMAGFLQRRGVISYRVVFGVISN